jgi:tetratricopeptide (TPR) repeat protein
MSGLGWLGSIAGAWLAAMAYRWRRDVVRQRRERARDLARRAVGRLPPFRASRRPWILAGVWAAALYAAVAMDTTGHFLIAWLMACLPVLIWLLVGPMARRSLKRGRYDRALRLVGFLLFRSPGSARLLLRRGEILLASGRLTEAEDVLRRSLAQSSHEGRQARALECLAEVLNAQDRHKEALRAIEGALKVMPRGSGLHNALAETHLRQGTEVEEALDHTNRALDYEGKARHKSGPNRFAEIWANQAWALGLLGRRDAMLLAVRRALQAADDSEQPQMAGIFWRLGVALRAAGEDEAARQHFEDARATDPQGLYGTLAAKALGEG